MLRKTRKFQFVWSCLSLIQNGTLQWRHNERDGVPNHRPHECLFNRLFRRRSKKTSKLRVTGLCAGNPPVTSLTNATWRCRKNFSQWERRFNWKLRCHWLEFLRQRQITVVRQGPVTRKMHVSIWWRHHGQHCWRQQSMSPRVIINCWDWYPDTL